MLDQRDHTKYKKSVPLTPGFQSPWIVGGSRRRADRPSVSTCRGIGLVIVLPISDMITTTARIQMRFDSPRSE